MLTTDRDIIALDLETTGTNVSESYIIQIAIQRLKLLEGRYKSISEWKTYIKPPIDIPEIITEITGITNEMVADAPIFSEIAPIIMKGLKGCDIMSYNAMMLDLPLLAEECDRAGVQFLKLNEFRIFDPYNIFCIHEPRTLSGAIKFYCNTDIEDAHDAMGDVRAMVQVFNAQLERYQDMPTDADEFHTFCNQRNDLQYADFARKLHWKEGILYYTNWGKYKNLPVETDWGYVDWINREKFPQDTKRILNEYQSTFANN